MSLVLGLSFCGPPMMSAVGAGLTAAKEHQIKAAFTYNFLKFVEWPSGRFEDADSPIVIGVVGKSPLTAALEVVKDRKINERGILVRAVTTPEEARSTHLLFFAPSEDKRLDDLLPALAGHGVLTVGESNAFARSGGMINFVLESDKVRFEINMLPVDQAGLKVSAQLQKLAKIVRRKP